MRAKQYLLTLKKLWRADFRGFFSKGTNDPNLALLKVDIESREYWDEPSNLCVRAFAYAKSITTGKKHQPTPDGTSESTGIAPGQPTGCLCRRYVGSGVFF